MRTGATFRPFWPFWPAVPSWASSTAAVHSLAAMASVALRELAAATRTYSGAVPAGMVLLQPLARPLPAGVLMAAVEKV